MARPRPIRVRQRLAWAGLVGVGLFALAVVALHAASFRHEPAHMSQFANTRFAGVWLLAVCSLIVGGSLLVWAVRPCLRHGRCRRLGLALMAGSWLGAVLLAAFPTDAVQPATVRGHIHDKAALATFVLVGAAMVVLAPAFHGSPALGRFSLVSVALGVLVTAAWIVYLASTVRDLAVRAPAQRVLVSLIVAWFLLLALRLGRPTADQPPAARIRPKPSRAAG